MGRNSVSLWRVGAVGLTLVLMLSAIGTVGSVSAGQTSGSADEGDPVFSGPVEISAMGVTVSVGPPGDVDDDGIYRDINGDGEVTVLDGVLHAVVVTAVDAGELELTDEQANAVDIDENGDVDYDDAAAIVLGTDMGSHMSTMA